MADLSVFQQKLKEMSRVSLEMWQATFECFMKHDAQLMPAILEKEKKLNGLEKEATSALLAPGVKSDKTKTKLWADVVGDFELIGDYCKDILERIQIKIEENLLFSEEAVKDYEQVYRLTENALKEIRAALEKEDLSLVNSVLKNEEHIDGLVDKFRERHNERLIQGVCSPMACNMYLNMLDFTAAVYYHAKKIARNLLKIKS